MVVNHRTAPSSGEATLAVKLMDHGRDLTPDYYAYWKKDNSGFYSETFAQMLQTVFQQSAHD